MKLLARSHAFLILAAFIVAVFITGLFWEAPFHRTEQSFARLFSRVWEVAFLPVRFVLGRLSAVGVEPTRTNTTLVLACYLGLFVGLDMLVTKVARRMAD
jgi:hypothetical protein